MKKIKEILKMIDYEDELGYQNQKLCLIVPYKHDKSLSKVIVLNPFRKWMPHFSGITTTKDMKSNFLTKYIKIKDRTEPGNHYMVYGLYWM